MLGLWQPNPHIGAELANEPGTLCWSELISDDLAGSTAFYKGVFGWEAEDQGPPGWPLHGVEAGREVHGGHDGGPRTHARGNPPFWGVYFAVADSDVAVAKAESLGASVLVPPTDIEPGRFAVLVDPVGVMFNVLPSNPWGSS